jgi:rubredoxin
MLPAYKCSKCGSVFVEWTIGEERGTPWFFIQSAMKGERQSSLRANLICPTCGHNNGLVVWLAGSPLSVLNFDVTATILPVTGLTVEQAQVVDEVVRRVREMYPEETVVTFAEVKQESEGEEVNE